jgi:hypothetical protein
MINLVVHLGLMSLNIYVGHQAEKKGQSGALNYFIAGFCLMSALNVVSKL